MQPALKKWSTSLSLQDAHYVGARPSHLQTRPGSGVWPPAEIGSGKQPVHCPKNFRQVAAALLVVNTWCRRHRSATGRSHRSASHIVRRGWGEERLLRPRSAPGPGEELLRDFRAAEVLLIRAQEDLKNAGTSKRREDAEKALETAEETYADLEAQVQVANEDLARYPVPSFLPVQGDVNIAVTGSSGVGKSAFINAVRMHLTKGEDEIAATGIFQTTKEVERFRFPREYMTGEKIALKGKHEGEQATVVRVYTNGTVEVILKDGTQTVVNPKADVDKPDWTCWLWDLPGVGTKEFPQATYIKNMGIRHFDLVVLMTATRFTEPEALLLDELLMWGVPYFIVRNKIDVDIESEAELQGIEVQDINDPACESTSAATVETTKAFLATQLCDQLKALPKKTNRIALPSLIRIVEPKLEDLRRAVYCVSSRPKYKNYFDMDDLRAEIWSAVDFQRELREDVLERLRQGGDRFKNLLIGGFAKIARGARSFFQPD